MQNWEKAGSSSELVNFSSGLWNLLSEKPSLKKQDLRLANFKVAVHMHLSKDTYLTDKCFKTPWYS